MTEDDYVNAQSGNNPCIEYVASFKVTRAYIRGFFIGGIIGAIIAGVICLTV